MSTNTPAEPETPTRSPYHCRSLLEKLRLTNIPSFILGPAGFATTTDLEDAAQRESEAEALPSQREAEKARVKADAATRLADELETKRRMAEELRRGLTEHCLGLEKKVVELRALTAQIPGDVAMVMEGFSNGMAREGAPDLTARHATAIQLLTLRALGEVMPRSVEIAEVELAKVRRELAAIR